MWLAQLQKCLLKTKIKKKKKQTDRKGTDKKVDKTSTAWMPPKCLALCPTDCWWKRARHQRSESDSASGGGESRWLCVSYSA